MPDTGASLTNVLLDAARRAKLKIDPTNIILKNANDTYEVDRTTMCAIIQ